MYANNLMDLAQSKSPMAQSPQPQSLDDALAKYEQRKALISKMGLGDSWVNKANEGIGQGLNAMQSAFRPAAPASAAGGSNIAAQAAQAGSKAVSAGAGAAAAGSAGANAAAQKAGAASSAAAAAGAAM